MDLKVVQRKSLNVALASTMVLSLMAPAAAQNVSASELKIQNLLISEYIEGSSYNKALEIYNGTDAPIDLSEYTLESYINGDSSSKNTLELTGTLQPGNVFVIANNQADTAVKDKADLLLGANSVATFNGNDPIVLLHNGTIIDSLGQAGNASDFAKNATLVRKSTVTTGDTDVTDAFDSSQWTALAEDDFSNLGTYGEAADPGAGEPVVLSTIADARTNAVNTVVKVEGFVTASMGAGGKTNLYIQDDTAGIVVRASGLTAQPGDKVLVEGKLKDYHGLAQIEPATASDVTVTTPSAGVPAPYSLTANEMSTNGELYEGTFVKFTNVTIESVNQYGEFTVSDASGEFMAAPDNVGLLEVGKTYENILGVVDYSYGNFKLIPRSAFDVIETVFSVRADPASGNVVEGTEISLYTAAEGGVIYYTIDGSEPTEASTEYTTPIEITTDMTIKAVVMKDGETSEVATFTYKALKATDGLSIHDIQGEGHESPYKDMNVTNVEGIVTKLDGSNAFFMQTENPDDNEATSEGIFVYKRNSGVQVGDKVSVDGRIVEYREDGYSDANDLLTTEISGSSITILSSGNSLPEAVVIGEDRTPPTENIEDDNMTSFDPETDGLDFYESLEGMLIEIPNATVTGPVKYDELPVVTVTSADQVRTRAGGVLIQPNDYNPERMLIDVDGINLNAKTGDTLSGPVTGVVSYDYSNFKIRPTGVFPEVADGGTEREVTSIEAGAEDLTVASYNIENFHKGVGEEKISRIADSIINNMKTPDIIGLVEVQDNNGPDDDGTTDASESYQAIIDAIVTAGGPAYEFTEIAPEDKTDGGQPGGNIRVGFIYNPDRVQLADKEAGDASTAVGVTENGLTHNPGRIDPTNEAFDDSRKALAAEFVFNGEKVFVVANHFNSKRGDGALFGAEHPIFLGSEVQRLKQAAVINEFVNDINSKVEDANVVVLGDLNDFEFSAPINALEGDILTNMMEKLPLEERYTYIYQGNSQVLDHILVSNNLADITEIDSININADFSEQDGRASDHDPVLANIQFSKEVEVYRVSGADRYQTAIEISKKGWESADTVVIARGDAFPDALAGAPLAYKLDAPILLTQQNYMSKEIRDEIKRLGATKAVILGGEAAVSNYVDYQINGLGVKTERISGADRFETAANIAARLGGSPEKAVIANAYTFADALSVASYASQNGYPIVLTEQGKLPASSSKAIKWIDEQIVVGGENAVSTKVFKSLSNAERFSGIDRYATSAVIAKSLTPVTNKAIVATGKNFADALAGSVLAAKQGAEILLVQPTEVPGVILDAIEADQITKFHIIGGVNAVDEAVAEKLRREE
ncbi:cell wall-binding repeat-containing protein [Bacillus sp. SCS-153A]|uniref:cell wall-binding repeat-containing protein n=1 Tax=Rossellomorea sedimentorum TaxID=3115294 RepID=UPI00390653C5